MKKEANYLAGLRFGRLIVIGVYEPGSRIDKIIQPTVLCRCDCGTEKRISVNSLRAGTTISCGCFRKENSAKMGTEFGREGGLMQREYQPVESSARDLYAKYMKRRPGNLLFEDFFRLTQLSCYYCGKEPDQITISSSQRKTHPDGCQFIYNGLDRIDSTKGYDIDNVVPCCGTCNFMKRDLDTKDFYQQIMNIMNTRKEDFIKLGIRS